MKSILSIIILGSFHNLSFSRNATAFFVDTIFSNSLNEYRILNIYLPEGYSMIKKYPVIYAADGQKFLKGNGLIEKIDSLISNKFIKEVIIVGIHSKLENIPGEEKLKYRNYEYVKIRDTTNSVARTIFKNHFKFFTEEVISYIEEKYPVSRKPDERIFFGCSNGAGFGVTLGTEKPDLMKTFICMSPVGANFDNIYWDKNTYPLYYLFYGEKEKKISINSTVKFSEFLDQENYKYFIQSYNGGHDSYSWNNEFIKLLSIIL